MYRNFIILIMKKKPINQTIQPKPIPSSFQASPFEYAEFVIFAVRGSLMDSVSARILEKDQLETEIWLF